MIWAVFMPKNYTELIDSNNIHISYDREFFAIYANDLENYEIAEWYQIKNETKILRKWYGSWSEKLGLTAIRQVLLHRRKNFQGAPLILATESEVKKDQRCNVFAVGIQILPDIDLPKLPLLHILKFKKNLICLFFLFNLPKN